MKNIINRVRAWWNSGYNIEVKTQEEMRRGGLFFTNTKEN